MMKLSDNLSNLNYDRYKSFTISSKDNNNAILVFNGDTFKGLNAKSFSKEEIFYSQKRLRIISGLYGLIKPFYFFLYTNDILLENKSTIQHNLTITNH